MTHAPPLMVCPRCYASDVMPALPTRDPGDETLLKHAPYVVYECGCGERFTSEVGCEAKPSVADLVSPIFGHLRLPYSMPAGAGR